MTFYPPASLPTSLPSSEIHIWLVECSSFKYQENTFYFLLSPEEQEAARNFYFPKDRCLYTIAHGTLRLLLSQYLQVPATQIDYGKEEYGKPIILFPSQPTIHFNLSHSGEYALIALSHQPIGIDIEQIRPSLQYNMLAPHIMSPDEQKAFAQLPDIEKQTHFFQLWTRKEAYIKALGKGLAHPLQKFTISFDPDTPQLLEDLTLPNNISDWKLHHIYLKAGYTGALAYPKTVKKIQHYLFTPSFLKTDLGYS